MANPERKKQSWIKRINAFVHLYLGLVIGIIIFILGLTGCILAFEKEIENTFQPYRHMAQNKDLPVSKYPGPGSVQAIAARRLPGKKLRYIEYRKGENIVASFYDQNPAYYYQLYIDPSTGKVVKVKDMSREFFRIIIGIHYYLLLPPRIGQPVVASATLGFVILLGTGIYLWWPRNKAGKAQRFKIKWTAKWRRLNYDLHSVLGFYATWIVIFIAISGLAMGFRWVAQGIYFVNSGGQSVPVSGKPQADSVSAGTLTPVVAMDKLWAQYAPEMEKKNGSLAIEPETEDNHCIAVVYNARPGTYYKTDNLYFDTRTLKPFPANHLNSTYASATFADKIYRMNYDIHVGAIAGLPGKIMAFFASLICTSLPVTGFLFWRGRRKKVKHNPAIRR